MGGLGGCQKDIFPPPYVQKEGFFIQPLLSQSEMAQHSATVAISILAARLPTMDMYIRWIAIKLVHGVSSTKHQET